MPIGKSNDGQTLGDRLKAYEIEYETFLPHDEFIIIRLDGHKFSKFTKGFNRPYDYILKSTMEQTTIDLCKEFGAVTGYTQSDEITLVLLPSFTEKNEQITNTQIYRGRIQKLTSLVASYCSIRFNINLKSFITKAIDENIQQNNADYFKRLLEKVGTAWFDARAYGVKTPEEVTNSIIWRARDCIKNSKNMFAQTFCTHKSLLNKNSQEQIEYCIKETGYDWNEVNDVYKYGSLIKKVQVLRYSDYLKQNILRSEFYVQGINMSTFSEELVDLIMDKIGYKEEK